MVSRCFPWCREKGEVLNLEQKTITSVEVADMVGKEHKELLRDIRRYAKQFAESKIALGDFFEESTYKDNNNQSRPCYLVTKKGCEFIAHKLTGVKGTEFTAKYINRFHELEDAIKKPLTALEQIALLAQGTVELEQKVETVEQKVYSIENDMPLFGAESDELSAHVRRKAVEMLGGKKSEAYRDSKVHKKVFSDIYNQLKREFGIYDDEGKMKSYKALKRKDLADAHEFVDCYTLPAYLAEQINDCNAQIRMEDGADGV
jgi:Rha family phage regulatory protein